MKATTLDIIWWACPSLVVTQLMPSDANCQRSWSSTSAMATLNLLCTRAMSDLTTCRLSLSEWFWGRRSQTRQRPTVTYPPLRCFAGKREGGRRKESSQSSFLFLLPASSFLQTFLQRRQVFRLLQAEVLQEAEGSAEQVGSACRAGASHFRDQPAGPQRRRGAVAVDAAARLYRLPGDGLLVGDDRERLQGGVGEAVVFLDAEVALHVKRRFGRGHHLRRRFPSLEAHAAAAAVGGEGVDRGLHVFERRFGDAGESAGVHRLIGDEEHALHDELEPVQGLRIHGGRGLRLRRLVLALGRRRGWPRLLGRGGLRGGGEGRRLRLVLRRGGGGPRLLGRGGLRGGGGRGGGGEGRRLSGGRPAEAGLRGLRHR